MAANDNFAEAYVISGNGGSSASNNINCSNETGEPTNNGKTVWWKWTSPTSSVGNAYFFSTGGNSSGIATDFKSKIQIFTPNNPSTPTVSALTEAPYILDERKGIGGGFENGSRVAFNVQSNTDYYIRVDTRDGSQGQIYLQWGLYNIVKLGACTSCGYTLGDGIDCAAVVAFDQNALLSQATKSFGTWAAGLYIVQYCYGAWEDDGSWVVNESDQSSEFPSPNFTVNYTNASGGATTGFNYSTPTSGAPGTADYFNSEAAAIVAAGCMFANIAHAGGNVSLSFSDQPNASDDTIGSTSIYFGLFAITPSFIILSSSGNARSNCGANFSCSFNLKNNNQGSWGGITAQIVNEGEVTGASATPVALSNFAGYVSGATPTFTFQRTSNADTEFQITLRLTITKYNGTLLSDIGLPNFVVDFNYVMMPTRPITFSASNASLARSGDVISGTMTITFPSYVSGDFVGYCDYTAAILNTGGITGGTVSAISRAPTSMTLTVSFSAATPGNVNLISTIQIKDGSGKLLGQVAWNLTPLISMSASIAIGNLSTPGCDRVVDAWNFSITNSGLGPTANLQFVVKAGYFCEDALFPLSHNLTSGQTAHFNSTSRGPFYCATTPFTIGISDGTTNFPDFIQS